jgi:non-reducing end alpha-L-arabinofuranosidase
MPSTLNFRRAIGVAATASLAAAGPCDLYAAGNTPCVAAHSTTRALFSSYSGPLYEVMRKSDGTHKRIKPMVAGGVARSNTQDSFCSGTSCVITTIYDQSGRGNHLTPAPPGGAASGDGANGFDLPADAAAAPVTLDGHKVYGVYISPGMGYRNDDTSGVATGDSPMATRRPIITTTGTDIWRLFISVIALSGARALEAVSSD